MIDTFLKLLEKLTEYLRLRQERIGKTMCLIVTPMFNGLRLIHGDYLRMFESCLADLDSGVALSFISKRLVADRLDKEAVRYSIIAFVDSFIEDKRLAEYHSFFHAVDLYLHGPSLDRRDTRGICLIDLLRFFAAEDEAESFAVKRREARVRPQVRNRIRQMLEDLRTEWQEVSKQYAGLLSKSMTK